MTVIGYVKITILVYQWVGTSLWIQVQLQPNFFIISVFNLGIANGAKVGLKLRLAICTQDKFPSIE